MVALELDQLQVVSQQPQSPEHQVPLSLPRRRLATRPLLVKHVFQLQDLDSFWHLVGHLLHTGNQKNRL